MRNRFDEQLFELNEEMIRMGAMCEEAIGKAVTALNTGDVELANHVRFGSGCIDRMERTIENRCMKLLLHQQPVAKDLRLISAALKMITDMERIGDQAEDIAEIVTFLDGRTVGEMQHISDMAAKAIEMVTTSANAFSQMDMKLAEQVIAADDIVDQYFSEIKDSIIRWVADNPSDGEFALDLLMIAKYLERIGDHATNLAEWVIYAITGTHE